MLGVFLWDGIRNEGILRNTRITNVGKLTDVTIGI